MNNLIDKDEMGRLYVEMGDARITYIPHPDKTPFAGSLRFQIHNVAHHDPDQLSRGVELCMHNQNDLIDLIIRQFLLFKAIMEAGI